MAAEGEKRLFLKIFLQATYFVVSGEKQLGIKIDATVCYVVEKPK